MTYLYIILIMCEQVSKSKHQISIKKQISKQDKFWNLKGLNIGVYLWIVDCILEFFLSSSHYAQ